MYLLFLRMFQFAYGFYQNLRAYTHICMKGLERLELNLLRCWWYKRCFWSALTTAAVETSEQAYNVHCKKWRTKIRTQSDGCSDIKNMRL